MFSPSDADVQTFVRAFVAAGTYYADSDAARVFFNERVIDAYDDGPVPGGLYATVQRINPAVHQGSIERLYDDADPDSEFLEAETSVQVAGLWSVQWFSGQGPGAPSALDAARYFRLWANSPAGLEFLQAADFQFVRCGAERDLTTVVSDSTWEERAGLELQLAYRLRLVQSVGIIEFIPVVMGSDVDQIKGVFDTNDKFVLSRCHSVRASLSLPAPAFNARLSLVGSDPEVTD